MSIPEPFDIVDFANDMLSHMAMVRDEFDDPNEVKEDKDEHEFDSDDNDNPDQWGNDYGSPMYGTPPDDDPYWDNNG